MLGVCCKRLCFTSLVPQVFIERRDQQPLGTQRLATRSGNRVRPGTIPKSVETIDGSIVPCFNCGLELFCMPMHSKFALMPALLAVLCCFVYNPCSNRLDGSTNSYSQCSATHSTALWQQSCGWQTLSGALAHLSAASNWLQAPELRLAHQSFVFWCC